MSHLAFSQLPVISASQPRSLPRSTVAFLLSLSIHVGILLAGTLLLRGWVREFPVEENRRVSITLVQPTALREVAYFDEEPNSAGETDHVISQPHPTGRSEIAALPDASSAPQGGGTMTSTTENASSLPLPGMARAGEGLGISLPRPIIDPDGDLAAVLAEEAARVRPQGRTGPPASLAPFGAAAAQGHTFVFVLDRSRSMGEDGLGVLAAAEGELLRAVSSLGPEHEFQILAYNDHLKYCARRRLLKANVESVAEAKEFLQLLVADGPTDHFAALISALRLQPDVIFLLTDGDDPYIGVPQRARVRAAAGRTQIHCLQFGLQKPVNATSRECLEQLAGENGGSYSFIDMARKRR